jgi:hypothetical protein
MQDRETLQKVMHKMPHFSKIFPSFAKVQAQSLPLALTFMGKALRNKNKLNQ